MKRFGEIIGVEKTFTLADVDSANSSIPAQVTYKATPEDVKVDQTELERAYKKDPITKSAIFKSTQAIMAAGWKLQAQDPKVLEFFNNFIDNVGKVGERVTFDEILENIFKYQMIYGNAYLETVLGRYTKDDSNNIVDLVILDPKRIEYAKDSKNHIVLDRYGMSIGYTQKLPFGISPEGKGDKFPEDVITGADLIFLKPERICHFKFDTVGDRFYGIGLIEPSYVSIIRKMNIELAQTNSIFQRGTSPIIDYVGDEYHHPTPQQIINATKNLAKLQHNRSLALPNWHRVETVDIKETGAVDRTLRYLRENQSASLMTAMAIATGAGEATNRATLSTQLKFLEFALNGLVRRTMSIFRKQVFVRISEFQKFKEVPKIVWGNINVEEVNDKAKRLGDYVKNGILTPDKVTEFALESEGLK